MKKLLKDPLLHFLLIGAALFLIFEIIRGPGGDQDSRIAITQGDLESLKANFSRTWQRPPTESELSGLLEEKIRDEIAFREAIAMGLDQDDTVIRRRLRMKMELLIENIASVSPPSDEDLTIFLKNHRDSFHREPQVSFKHTYLNSDKRGTGVEGDARDLLAKLIEAGPGADPKSFGDPTMLPVELVLNSADTITRLFGKSFSENLLQVEPGNWTGPLRSSYGLHLVFVHERIAGRDPALSEIREVVEREWTAKRRKDFKKETYEKLRERYTIVIEGQTPSDGDRY